jgi:hypothetical protein
MSTGKCARIASRHSLEEIDRMSADSLPSLQDYRAMKVYLERPGIQLPLRNITRASSSMDFQHSMVICERIRISVARRCSASLRHVIRRGAKMITASVRALT